MPHKHLPDQLTIRDHFAMATLTKLLSNKEELSALGEVARENKTSPAKLVALFCYEYADAMITERNKKKE